MIKKTLKITIWLLLATLLLLTVFIAYLVSTQSGFQQLLSYGQDYAPGELKWQSAEGKLIGPLNLDEFSYMQADGLTLSLKSAEFDWSPSALLKGEVNLNHLAIDGLEIHLPEPADEAEQKEAESIALPQIKLPLGLNLNELDIRNIRLYPPGSNQAIEIKDILLEAGAKEDKFQLLTFNISTSEANVAVNGKIQASQNYPMNLDLKWRYHHPEFGEFNGEGDLHGSLKALDSGHSIKGPVNIDVALKLLDLLDNPGWQVEIQARSVSLGNMMPEIGNIPLDARVSSQGNLDSFIASADIVTDTPQTGPTSLDMQLHGNTQQLTIDEMQISLLTTPAKILLTGDVDIATRSVDLLVDWRKLGWPLQETVQSIHSSAGKARVQGSLENITSEISTELQGDAFGSIVAGLTATLVDNEITVSDLQLNSSQSDLNLEAEATYHLDTQHFSAEGQWQGLDLPLQGEAIVEGAIGSFTASGAVKNYNFVVNSQLAGKNIPEGNWQLSGTGSDKALAQFNLEGQTLGGTVLVKGQAAWVPDVIWDINLTGDKLNPGIQWQEWRGELDLSLLSNGIITESGPELRATINSLSGMLKEQSLAGKGSLAIVDNRKLVENLAITLGDSELHANGTIDEDWNLDWQLKSKNLSSLHSEISGSVSAKGVLKGQIESPQLNADFSMNQFTASGSSIGQLNGIADIFTDKVNASSLIIQGSDINTAGQIWTSLRLKGAGKPEAHSVSLDLQGDLADIKTQINGALAGENWQGTLNQLSLLNTQLGSWTLESPASIEAGTEQAKVKPICLSSSPAHVCLEGNWSSAKGSSANISVDKLDSARFADFFPEGLQVKTSLFGTAKANINAESLINAQADFELSDGQLIVNPGNESSAYTIAGGSLTADLQAESLRSVFNLDLASLGRLEADTRVMNISDKPTLSGRVKTEINDLTLISTFAPQLQSVNGIMQSDLTLAGSLSAPAINGFIQLKDFSAEVPEFALLVEETNIVAKSDASGALILSGQSHSGGGTLDLSGEFHPQTQSLDLLVSGDKFQVANSSQIQARISPEMQISMNNQGLRVEGDLLIPSAYINANGGNEEIQTVGGSADVVIVEEESKEAPESGNNNVSVDLKIQLGEDIRVKAGDFQGALKGSLHVEQTPELAPRGTGTIEVVNGDYVIYGQQLNMQRGKILFGGGPVDNPQLDMDVARTVEAYDVVAGARIRGTAQSPRLQLYSEPSMPDASILSYILLGQPPGTTGGSYTIGKNLTPDLYVSYGIGLFNAINTFNMRYRLTEKLAVQAASSTASSADLIYTIEK